MATKTAEKDGRLSSIHEDGSRRSIHPADVKGRFVTWRRVVYAVLIGIYVALPFLRIGGNPAVFLDIVHRRFYLFGHTFNAQDVWLVVFLLTSLGFGLLFLTAWLGRVWCGWACPQTVFLEGVYRRVERWFDGPRNQRLREAGQPLTPKRALRTVGKHATYFVISFLLAHVFLSLFVSLQSLLQMMQGSPRDHWVAFSGVAGTIKEVYLDFAWFREQLCIVVCPYGRLQSARQDDHSLVIGYDVGRGEPRGRLRRADRVALPQVQGEPLATAASAATRGDCVDCNRCVVVCPTGIDIRDGLQMECIGCAQCVDACDEVMLKIGRDPGLIRYDSLAGLAGKPKKTLRPRLAAYGAFLLLAATGLTIGLLGRTPFEANVLRVRGTPYVLEEGTIRNQFELHLVNKNPGATELKVRVTSPVDAVFTLPTDSIHLESLESFRLPVFIRVSRDDFEAPFDLTFEIQDGASSRTKVVKGQFLGPRKS
jgi:cytochrome c oxidase accessory protein FixG